MTRRRALLAPALAKADAFVVFSAATVATVATAAPFIESAFQQRHSRDGAFGLAAAAAFILPAHPPDGGVEDGSFVDKEDGIHTFVEGSSYEGDLEAEVLAMGGDPFFLTDAEDDPVGANNGDEDERISTASTSISGSLNAAVSADGEVGSKGDAKAERFSTDGLGPTRGSPSPLPVADDDEWDGWAVEDAHFD